MPYDLRKAPSRNLYWVVAEDGTHKSREPMPKERAKAQMRALYAAMGRGYSDDHMFGKGPATDQEIINYFEKKRENMEAFSVETREAVIVEAVSRFEHKTRRELEELWNQAIDQYGYNQHYIGNKENIRPTD